MEKKERKKKVRRFQLNDLEKGREGGGEKNGYHDSSIKKAA